MYSTVLSARGSTVRQPSHAGGRCLVCCMRKSSSSTGCKRLVGVKHRVVFGTIGAIEQVLSVYGWKINTAFVEVRPVGRKEAEASG
jgi:hypothetical protein